MNPTVSQLKIKLFADGADKAGMLEMYRNPLIKGFTTNPTLMRKAGISDYATFAQALLKDIPDRPISLEVFADEFDEMERQALKLSRWGKNVYVKIPVTNTRKESAVPLIRKLSHEGIKLNVTAVMAPEQIAEVGAALAGGAHRRHRPRSAADHARRRRETAQDPGDRAAVGQPARALEHLPGR
jgi:transaldolase